MIFTPNSFIITRETAPPDVRSRRCGHPWAACVLLPRCRKAIVDDIDDSHRACLPAQCIPPEWRLVCAAPDGDQGSNYGNTPTSNQGAADEEIHRGCISGAFSEGAEGRIGAPAKNGKRRRERFRFPAARYRAPDQRPERAIARQ